MLKNFNLGLIESHDHLLCAVSGGIDSMVLLDYLIQIKESYNLTISVAHIDHQKRADSSKDAEFIEKFAKHHHLDFYLYQLEDQDYDNFHDYAHVKRYEFFSKIANKCHAHKLVLAHHLDDLAETIMMRLVRGSSFEGYAGIPELSTYQSVQMIRPMLYVKREAIEAYQKKYNIPYRNDESNQKDDYTRNRFRHHLMPLLKQENPKYLDKIKQFAEYQTSAYKLIEKERNLFLSELQIEDQTIRFDITTFLQQLKIVQIDIIKYVVNQLTKNQLELSYQNIQDIIDMTESQKPHVEYHIGNHLHIYKSYQDIQFRLQTKDDDDFECVINDFGHFKVDNHIEALIAKKANKNYDYIYKLCYNNLDLTFPLIIRNRRSGDRLDINIGTKKLKDFFIDKKVPMQQRNQLPLVVNQTNEILFIPALYSKKQSGKDSIYIHLNIQ